MAHLVVATIAAVWLIGCSVLAPADPGFGYSTGRARVEVIGLPVAPRGPLTLRSDSSGYAPDGSDEDRRGATAMFEDAEGWRLFLSRFDASGGTGDVSLTSPDDPGPILVSGELPIRCQVELAPDYPNVFSGTVRCPHLFDDGRDVALVVEFSARP